MNLDTFTRSAPEWNLLRSATFESIRLSGLIIGHARVCLKDVPLRSDPSLSIPKGQAVTLSSYYIHRQIAAWGNDAATYDHQRFLKADPPIGEPDFVVSSLKVPHMCPGQWFGMEVIMIVVKTLFDTYDFAQDRVLRDDEKYVYSGGFASRKEMGVSVRKRQ